MKNIPSGEERLRAIRRSVILIEAVLHASESDCSMRDSEEYVGVAIEECREMDDEIRWLEQLPAAILNTDAPDFDQAKAITAGAQ